MLGYFDNCNTNQFENKTTSIEDFNYIHKNILDGISNNMASFFHTGKYGAINAADPTTMGYQILKFVYDSFTLQ